ncbi:MAG: DMT family transporter [Clostridium sp.]|uniref:DMT family transporter n=1 Tax=Clostridium sp. TaxID=1506 RepID=UPI003056B79D
MYNFISILLGGLIALMISVNGMLSGSFGNYTATVIIHVVGLIAIILVLIIKKAKISFKEKLPILLYSAGAIGVFTVLFTNLSFSILGASLTICLSLFGQVIASMIIDHYGLLGMNAIKFEKKKLLGLGIMVLGLIVMTIC